MKILKLLLILIGLLVGIGLIAGLVLPKEVNVERSIEIDAPKDIIFEHIGKLENHLAWSPWKELDPNAKYTYEGESGAVGSKAKWEGNKNVGRGEQEITAIKVNERMETKLTFFEPQQGSSDVLYALSDVENGSKVSWSMNFKTPMPSNVMVALMGMKNQIGSDYDKGLASLKALCEEAAKNASASPKFDIQQIDLPAKTYMTHRATVSMADVAKFYATHFGAMAAALGDDHHSKMTGMPSGLFYSWDMENQVSDMAAGMPVAEAIKMNGDYKAVEIPGGKALVVDHYGPYEATPNAHNAIDEYLKANSLTMKYPVIEEYVTDPGAEPDQAKWLTKITYYLE
ncbi:MAG: GyrI-like domain-containing protein [Bacteroidota bacterium]